MNLFSPTKAIRQADIGEPFVSHWNAKNLASNFLRAGVTGTTRNAFLVFQDTGESVRVTVGTVTHRPVGIKAPDHVKELNPFEAIVKRLQMSIDWHTQNQNDPHNISNAVIAALLEVQQAIKEATV
jgi:hypothetical protein